MGLFETTAFIVFVFVSIVYQIRASIRNKSAGWGKVSYKELITSPVLSERNLALMRLSIAAFEIGGILHRIFFGRIIPFCNSDETRCVPYGGPYLLTTFTVWSWNAQAIYFLITGIAGLFPRLIAKRRVLVFTLWVLFEVSFAVALLVFIVVWTVLIPRMEYGVANNIDVEAAKRGLRIMFSFWALCFHNLNVVFTGLELAVNSLPFVFAHVHFVCLYGLSYVVFSWVFHHYTGVWYYFFLDYARPEAVIAYAVLLLVLLAFFSLGLYIANTVKPALLKRFQAAKRSTRVDASRARSRGTSSQSRGSRKSPRSASKRRGGRTPRRGSGESADDGMPDHGRFVVGADVIAKFSYGGWFGARITGAKGGVFEIEWHDGVAEDRLKRESDLRPTDFGAGSAFQIGDEVMAQFADGGWYEAAVLSEGGSKVEVSWADGTQTDQMKQPRQLRRLFTQ